MKYLPSPKKDLAEPRLIFQINPREEALLLAILRLYPVLASNHYQISKDPKAARSAEQRLLEESMGQLRAEHRRKLDEMFRAPQRFFKDAPGERRLVLTGVQLEWLLQVLIALENGDEAMARRNLAEAIRPPIVLIGRKCHHAEWLILAFGVLHQPRLD
jgi:hypothetical protein